MTETISEYDDFCKICNKITNHQSATYDDETDVVCLEHEEDEEQRYEAGKKIVELQSTNIEKDIQDLLHDNHTESNCRCNQPLGTATMRSEGAGDMDICLKCFGAEGCVY